MKGPPLPLYYAMSAPKCAFDDNDASARHVAGGWLVCMARWWCVVRTTFVTRGHKVVEQMLLFTLTPSWPIKRNSYPCRWMCVHTQKKRTHIYTDFTICVFGCSSMRWSRTYLVACSTSASPAACSAKFTWCWSPRHVVTHVVVVDDAARTKGTNAHRRRRRRRSFRCRN